MQDAKTCVCGPCPCSHGLVMGLSLNPPAPPLRGFFKQPCLHFPLVDTYVQGGALLEELGEEEDDPNGTPDAEPAELTAMGAQDAAGCRGRAEPADADGGQRGASNRRRGGQQRRVF